MRNYFWNNWKNRKQDQCSCFCSCSGCECFGVVAVMKNTGRNENDEPNEWWTNNDMQMNRIWRIALNWTTIWALSIWVNGNICCSIQRPNKCHFVRNAMIISDENVFVFFLSFPFFCCIKNAKENHEPNVQIIIWMHTMCTVQRAHRTHVMHAPFVLMNIYSYKCCLTLNREMWFHKMRQENMKTSNDANGFLETERKICFHFLFYIRWYTHGYWYYYNDFEPNGKFLFRFSFSKCILTALFICWQCDKWCTVCHAVYSIFI